MAIVNKPTEIIVKVATSGKMYPIRIRFEDETGELRVVNFQSVVEIPLPISERNIQKRYKCRSVEDGIQRDYEIKYSIQSCKWTIYKV